MIIIIVLLIIFNMLVFVYIVSMRLQIKNLVQQIKMINNNKLKRVSIPLVNRNIVEIAAQMNKMIKRNEGLNLEISKKDINLKRMMANLSHDFRTPLTSIIGYIQLLDKSNLNNKQLEHINIIERKSYELRDLADVFFQLSILELNETKIEFKRVNVGNLITNIIIDNIDIIERENFNFESNISKEPIYAELDEVLIKRVFQNLITNSLRYGVKKLYVGTIIDDKNIKIIFKNDINESDIDLNRIFDEFYCRSSSGTGLGLSISKTLIEKMNGEIKAKANGHDLTIEIKIKRYT